MYYKEKQDSVPNKNGKKLWRPEVVRTGKMVDTKSLCRMISTATTLTRSDVAAVLYSLPEFMDVNLREGHSVRLDGVGTFTVYGRSRGRGVENKKDVHPTQFGSLVLKFTPEYTVPSGGARMRSLLNDIEFTHIEHLTKRISSNNNANHNDNQVDD